MNCVKCNGQLVPVRIDGIEVDKCNVCSGIWFDIGELDSVLKADDITKLKNVVDNNRGDDEINAPCPKCSGSSSMVRVVSPQDNSVHIDTCTVCYGNWLDGGELENLKKKNDSILFGIKKFLGLI